MKKISLRQIIQSAVEETDPIYLREYPLLLKWARKADQEIGAYYQYKRKIQVAEINNCQIPIPCDGVYILDVILGDYGCDCDTMFEAIESQAYYDCYDILDYDNVTEITRCYTWTNDMIAVTPLRWEVQGDCIVFENSNDQYATFKYLAYETDAEGDPIVYSVSEDAIVAYIKMKLASRSKWRLLQAGKPTNQLEGEIQKLNARYNVAVKKARGEHGRPSASQEKEIGDILNNPLSGRRNYLLENLH